LSYTDVVVGKRSILIVGGGTAGWLTAAYLAKALGPAATITLLEAPEIGIVGVGEGTFPTIRETLRFLDVPESDFLRATAATFKQGVRFDGWLDAPGAGATGHCYLHPFEPPFPAPGLTARWLTQDPGRRAPFAQAVTIQDRVAGAGRAPKQSSDGDFEGPLPYAYHFDAVRLAAMLADRARALGVEHCQARLTGVALDGRGWIKGVDTAAGQLRADLYVDCTGFGASLIGSALRSPFHSVADQLFTDRALTVKLPYVDADQPIESTTIATAHEAGWLWDIGLTGARGVGCVYSSRHLDDNGAAAVLRRYIGDRADEVTPRRLTFEAGWRERQWVGNCVAVGLSAGFLEPLESTGVVLIEVAAAMIAELLPHTGDVDAPAARFNEVMAARFAGIVDFLKLHYCLSRRPEPFWRDNADPATLSPRLAGLLDQWRQRPPSRFDFPVDTETFAYFNYQYILYGMGFVTAPSALANPADDRLFQRIRTYGERAARELPPHRRLVERLAGQAGQVSPARTGS
jgi:glycine/D-amino acid oxidase-like deaminating enzyme